MKVKTIKLSDGHAPSQQRYNASSHRTVSGNHMEAYDALPKAVRQALANADFNWAAIQVRSWPGDQTSKIARIGHADRERHTADAKAGLVCPGQRVTAAILAWYED